MKNYKVGFILSYITAILSFITAILNFANANIFIGVVWIVITAVWIYNGSVNRKKVKGSEGNSNNNKAD